MNNSCKAYIEKELIVFKENILTLNAIKGMLNPMGCLSTLSYTILEESNNFFEDIMGTDLSNEISCNKLKSKYDSKWKKFDPNTMIIHDHTLTAFIEEFPNLLAQNAYLFFLSNPLDIGAYKDDIDLTKLHFVHSTARLQSALTQYENVMKNLQLETFCSFVTTLPSMDQFKENMTKFLAMKSYVENVFHGVHTENLLDLEQRYSLRLKPILDEKELSSQHLREAAINSELVASGALTSIFKNLNLCQSDISKAFFLVEKTPPFIGNSCTIVLSVKERLDTIFNSGPCLLFDDHQKVTQYIQILSYKVFQESRHSTQSLEDKTAASILQSVRLTTKKLINDIETIDFFFKNTIIFRRLYSLDGDIRLNIQKIINISKKNENIESDIDKFNADLKVLYYPDFDEKLLEFNKDVFEKHGSDLVFPTSETVFKYKFELFDQNYKTGIFHLNPNMNDHELIRNKVLRMKEIMEDLSQFKAISSKSLCKVNIPDVNQLQSSELVICDEFNIFQTHSQSALNNLEVAYDEMFFVSDNVRSSEYEHVKSLNHQAKESLTIQLRSMLSNFGVSSTSLSPSLLSLYSSQESSYRCSYRLILEKRKWYTHLLDKTLDTFGTIANQVILGVRRTYWLDSHFHFLNNEDQTYGKSYSVCDDTVKLLEKKMKEILYEDIDKINIATHIPASFVLYAFSARPSLENCNSLFLPLFMQWRSYSLYRAYLHYSLYFVDNTLSDIIKSPEYEYLVKFSSFLNGETLFSDIKNNLSFIQARTLAEFLVASYEYKGLSVFESSSPVERFAHQVQDDSTRLLSAFMKEFEPLKVDVSAFMLPLSHEVSSLLKILRKSEISSHACTSSLTISNLALSTDAIFYKCSVQLIPEAVKLFEQVLVVAETFNFLSTSLSSLEYDDGLAPSFERAHLPIPIRRPVMSKYYRDFDQGLDPEENNTENPDNNKDNKSKKTDTNSENEESYSPPAWSIVLTVMISLTIVVGGSFWIYWKYYANKSFSLSFSKGAKSKSRTMIHSNKKTKIKNKLNTNDTNQKSNSNSIKKTNRKKINDQIDQSELERGNHIFRVSSTKSKLSSNPQSYFLSSKNTSVEISNTSNQSLNQRVSKYIDDYEDDDFSLNVSNEKVGIFNWLGRKTTSAPLLDKV